MDNTIVTLLPTAQTDSSLLVVLPTVGDQQQKYLLKGLQGAANTERAYRADLDHYTEWCLQQGMSALPATPAVLGQYVSVLAPHRKWATIARRLSAVRKWHELREVPSPIDDRWLKATLKGIQREHGTHAEQAPAFSADQLKVVLRGIVTESKGVPRFAPLRDKIVLLLGFTGAFRRSELVALNVEQLYVVNQKWTDAGEKRRDGFTHFGLAEKYDFSVVSTLTTA